MSALAVALALSACSPATSPSGIVDPNEAQNRAVHRANKALDRGLVRPVSAAYGQAVPAPVRTGIGNVAANLSLPGKVANSLLQLRPGDAAQNTTRFLINSTIGLGGLFDPATPMTATEIDTDFGETLYVWGFAEGSYVELPLLGPSTSRHTVGRVVDLALNPLSPFLSPEAQTGRTAVRVLSRVGDRHDNSELIDSLLYDSADSYAQLRQIYLQNRRNTLRRNGDPGYFNPYEDPYEDPYGQ